MSTIIDGVFLDDTYKNNGGTTIWNQTPKNMGGIKHGANISDIWKTCSLAKGGYPTMFGYSTD